MGAAGLRGVALAAGPHGGVELAVKTDAMAVRTTSHQTRGLAAAEAVVTRLRLGLEGSWRGLELGAGTLLPTAEVGVRYDDGDAETGFGLDVGGGLSWSSPEHGVSAEVRGRGLVTHESPGLRDLGFSGGLSWAPGGSSGRGPSVTLVHTVGAPAAGGADELLARPHLAGLVSNDPATESRAGNADGGDGLLNRRLDLSLGYGLGGLEDRFTMTPELALGLSDGRREYALGWRFGLAQGGRTALEVGSRRPAARR